MFGPPTSTCIRTTAHEISLYLAAACVLSSTLFAAAPADRNVEAGQGPDHALVAAYERFRAAKTSGLDEGGRLLLANSIARAATPCPLGDWINVKKAPLLTTVGDRVRPKLDTKINGKVATTHVEQTFRNDTSTTLEGTYFFPIPETASIVEFAIWENGKKLVGEVRTREEARRIYDAIVGSQRDPGLLEYAGKDLFQASIFPIPPNSDK